MSYLCVFKRSLLGVKDKFKIPDEHPRLFHMGVPPPGASRVGRTALFPYLVKRLISVNIVLTG